MEVYFLGKINQEGENKEVEAYGILLDKIVPSKKPELLTHEVAPKVKLKPFPGLTYKPYFKKWMEKI